MNPEPPVPDYSPFSHLRPELWERSKVAHIVLFVVATLLMIPAAYGLVAAVILMTMWSDLGSFIDREAMIVLATGMISTCSGIFAWCSLGILFFKRADARWQRFCWAVCAVFGFVTTPCAIGWWIYVSSEVLSLTKDPDVLWAHGIFLLFITICFASIILGLRYSRRAGKEVRSIPENPRRDIR